MNYIHMTCYIISKVDALGGNAQSFMWACFINALLSFAPHDGPFKT